MFEIACYVLVKRSTREFPQFWPASNITILNNNPSTQYIVAYTNETDTITFIMHKWSWYDEYLGNFTTKKKMKYRKTHFYKLSCGVGIAYKMPYSCQFHKHEYIFAVNSNGNLYTNKLTIRRQKPESGQ